MKHIASALGSLLLLAAAACGGPSTTSPPAPSGASSATTSGAASSSAAPASSSTSSKAGGGQLVLGTLEEPGSLSPLVDLPHHFPEHVPQTLLFDSLTQFMPDSTVAPKLAESWTISPDGKEYVFKLTDKAKWWDGKPVTAEDAKITFDIMRDPKSGSSDEGVDMVDKAEAVDARTFKVTLKQLTPMFLAQGGARGIVPRHVVEGKDLSKDEFNKKPLGSGPYKFVSWVPGQAITMEANPDYWRGGPPKIRTIIFKVLADQNVVLTQLRSGEIDYALVQPKDVKTVEGMNRYKLYERQTTRFFDIAPNYKKDPDLFGDLRVRQALLAATDRQGIVDKVLLGHGVVVDSNVGPVSWGYNPNVEKHPYDRAKAEGLLQEAGWAKGADGILARNGRRFAFSVMVNNFDRTLQQALTVMQANLKDVGIDMKIDVVEPGTFGARRKSGDFDSLTRIWNPVYDPDQASLLIAGGKNNFYGYANPEADRLARAALAAVDQAERKKIYMQLQDLLAHDVARLWLYSENELHELNARVTGPEVHPVNFFWNIKDWQIE